MSDHETNALHRDNAIRTFENDKLVSENKRLRIALEIILRDSPCEVWEFGDPKSENCGCKFCRMIRTVLEAGDA